MFPSNFLTNDSLITVQKITTVNKDIVNIELAPTVQDLEPLRYNATTQQIESYTDTTPVLSIKSF